MAAEAQAASEPSPPKVPPLEGMPRASLRGTLDRLSPSPRSAVSAERPASHSKANKIRSQQPPRSPEGSGTERPPAVAAGQAALDRLGVAEAHELVARAVCEAVRGELRERMKEATCALQNAVRSEVSLALSASPSAGAGSPHHREEQERGSEANNAKMEPTSAKSTSSLLAGSKQVSWNQDSEDRSESKVSKTDSDADLKRRNLSKFAEKQGQTEVLDASGATLLDRVTYVWTLKEPQRNGPLARLFQTPRFEVAIQAVITANCVFMALAANSEIANWDADRNPMILPIEIVFQVIYTLELIGKLSVHRLFFFWNEDWALNLLDITLVGTGVLDLGLRMGNLWNLSYMRSLRVVKVAKALRLVRVINCAVQLRNIFICIIGSLMNFVWSIVMLAVVLYMFSLGLVISAGTYLHDEVVDDTSETAEMQRADLLSMYGSVQQSMLTLYKATTGGDDWSLSYNAISSTGWVPSMVYLIFVAFMQIALVNIITAIFVDTALQKLAPDREAIALSHHSEKEVDAKKMRSLWREVAAKDDGYLSSDDFFRGLRGTKIPYLFEDLGLSVDNVTHFFGVLQENSPEDGKVRITNFVHGCMRLKGSASSYDMQEMRSEVYAIGRKLDRFGARPIGSAVQAATSVTTTGSRLAVL